MSSENAYLEKLLTLAAKKRGWGEIALVLLEVEASGSWRDQADTLSDWVASVAQALGLGEASIWRYLSSARYALELRGVWLGQASDEDLADLLNQASPENLELLSKLSRVAPPEVFEDMKHHVLLGSISRAKLRAVWQDFRPALGGRTAQGIGKATPRVDLSDPEQQAAVFRGLALTALGNFARLLGESAPHAAMLFKDVGFDRVGMFDAVCAVQQTEWSRPTLHGIVIAKDGKVPSDLRLRAEYADATWFITAGDVTPALPRGVGHVSLSNNELRVVLSAMVTTPDAAKSEYLLRAVLLRVLSR
jgi:hypothetical protein